MAYNPNTSYEPPRRGYYGQQQQQPPIQNGYGNQYQEQYDEYAQQGWNGGYEQQYDYGYGQDMRHDRTPRSPQYQDQYNAGYQDSRQQGGRAPIEYEERQPRRERQYDPKYQQRPERGRQQQYEQSQPQPQARQPRALQPPADAQYLMQQSRPNPKNGRVYPQEAQAQAQGQSYAPQPVKNSSSRPQTAPHQGRRHDPSNSMQEWKAKERARMHQENMSPETLAWDNAFPTFPTKRERSRPATANRESTEQSRPDTGDGQYQDRPDMTRGASYNGQSSPQRDPHMQQEQRPMISHQAHSFDEYQQAPQQRPQYERQPTSPNQGRLPQQWPAPNQPQPPSNMQYDRRQPPPQSHGSVPQYGQDERYAQQQPRQGPSRGKFVQPIDTQIEQPPRPAYMDHQPLSPANIPQRPSTSQGSRGQPSNFMTSPTSAYPTTQSPQDYRGGPAAQAPNAWPQNGHPEQHADMYGGYNDNRNQAPTAPAVQTREQEIEAEMPDFDSAAPGGTSLLHKRTQNAESQANPPPQVVPQQPSGMPLQQANSSSSLPAQNPQFYAQQQDQSARSLPDQRGLKQKQGGITDGFVFGIPDESAQQQSYGDPYQQNQSNMLYSQPNAPIQPPGPGGPPRRSLDDTRQMPYRQGPPPQQRGNPNSRGHPRGPAPAQRGPGMERNAGGQRPPQPAYADPVQERGGSAPPMRPNYQQPPSGGPRTVPPQQQRPPPNPQEQRSNSNPDSLPQHPTPVRPGLMEGGNAHPSKPPPVRNYPNNGPPQGHQHQRSLSLDQSSKPVTRQELDRLRASVDANPGNGKQGMVLVKKLVEASTVLAPEGGRADPPTAAKNREMYINDAYKRVKRLVAAGNPDAQFYLADCYGQGSLGLEVDPREAFNLYQAAAKAGHAEAAYRTAMCCEMGATDGGGTRQDYAKAVQWYRRAAALGDSSGMFKIGIILLKGLLGQQRNVGEGVSWLKRVAERGDCDNPQALYELANLYDSANTNPEVRNKVIPDDNFARELFDKAAHMGHKYAQFRLGQAYEYGSLGIVIDNRQSISWYSKAAAQGEHQAELALSGWYLTGAEGILEHSDMEAYLWARKAAQSEPPLAKAMFAMGYFTETGIGCPASLDEAKKWYGRAATLNFPKARERLEELRRNGGKASRPVNGKLSRKDQKRDEAECVVM